MTIGNKGKKLISPMKVFYIIQFLVIYFWELTSGAFRVALDVVTVKNLATPGILRFPLSLKTDFEITLLSNLITFSPGSMVVAVSEDKKFLDIHLMFLENEREEIDLFRERYENRIKRIMQ